MNRPRIKPWEELTICDDYMFKRVMRRKRLCKKMIETILRIRIREIKYIDEERTIQATYGGKGIRMDVYVEDDENTVFNVEMQVRNLREDGLFKRIRYYQAIMDTDLLVVGADYSRLNQTFIIFICPFVILDGRRHIYTFRNVCLEDRNIEMPDGTTRILLSTKGTLDDVPPDLRAFLDYVDGVFSAEDAFVAEIDKEIKEIKSQEVERVRYMTDAIRLADERYAGIEEGIGIGEKQGTDKTNIDHIRTLMKKLNYSVEEAMDFFDISPDMRKEIAPLI